MTVNWQDDSFGLASGRTRDAEPAVVELLASEHSTSNRRRGYRLTISKDIAAQHDNGFERILIS
jgi:hypothetical protein